MKILTLATFFALTLGQAYSAQFEGDTAKALFESLNVKPNITGVREVTKNAGAVTCLKKLLLAIPRPVQLIRCKVRENGTQGALKLTYESLKVPAVRVVRVGATTETKTISEELSFLKINAVRPGVPAKYSIEF